MSICGHNLASFSHFVKHLIGKNAPDAEMVPVNMADISKKIKKIFAVHSRLRGEKYTNL